VVLLIIQPFLGFIHHHKYLATQKRTKWASLHVWYGRILILVGIINGGLGLQLADNSKNGMIVYGVIAGLIGATYCIGMIKFELSGKEKKIKSTSDIGLEERTEVPVA
jgi:uncharacterized membrane protein YeaQ/YmgE (transglycosylase-associated protein family)